MITISQTVPAINSLSIKVIKYLGGKIIVKYWKTKGIEFIGNISPESNNAGKKPIPKDTWLAKNWFFSFEEINKPIPKDVNKNNPLTKNSIKRFPLNGILKTTRHINTLKVIDNIPSVKYGIYLPNTISIFLTLVVKRASIVPRSHSLAITRAVSNIPISVIVIAIDPGKIK